MIQARRVPAAARAAAILRRIAHAGRPLTVAALASGLALPRSSTSGICDALVDERLLVRLPDGGLWLGSHVLELAAAAAATMNRALGVGLLIVSQENPFYTAILDAAAAEIGDDGRLMVRNAREDPATQRAQWRELLDAGADVLIVDSVDAEAPPEELALAHRAGVPVIAIGSRLDGVDASVTSDNTQAGLLAGRFLVERLGGRGTVAIIDGLRKNANADRVAGLREALHEARGIEVVAHERPGHDTPEAGAAAMAGVLGAAPGVDAVFAVCDPIALGAATAQAERGARVPIVSVDGRADALRTILDGGPIVASVAQEPARLIVAAIRIARELARGRPPVQRTHLVPVRLIDETTAAESPRWG